MPKLDLSFKNTNKLAFYFAALILGGLIFLQIQFNMVTCGLTNIERTLLFALAIIFLANRLYDHSDTSKTIFNWTEFIISLLGIATVSRHLWVQQFAPVLNAAFSASNPAYYNVSPNNPLSYIMPLLLKLKTIYLGSPAGCSRIYKLYWEIRLTEVMLGVFILFAIISFWQQFRQESSGK